MPEPVQLHHQYKSRTYATFTGTVKLAEGKRLFLEVKVPLDQELPHGAEIELQFPVEETADAGN